MRRKETQTTDLKVVIDEKTHRGAPAWLLNNQQLQKTRRSRWLLLIHKKSVRNAYPGAARRNAIHISIRQSPSPPS